MWLELIAAAEEKVPTPPPDIPFEQIGIVLVALVTGITAIIVAVIQRGAKKAEATPTATPATPVAASPVFVVSKEEWEKVRDSSIRVETQLADLKSSFDYHERMMLGEVRELDKQISRVHGHLGMP